MPDIIRVQLQLPQLTFQSSSALDVEPGMKDSCGSRSKHEPALLQRFAKGFEAKVAKHRLGWSVINQATEFIAEFGVASFEPPKTLDNITNEIELALIGLVEDLRWQLEWGALPRLLAAATRIRYPTEANRSAIRY